MRSTSALVFASHGASRPHQDTTKPSSRGLGLAMWRSIAAGSPLQYGVSMAFVWAMGFPPLQSAGSYHG
jgi:hypothetical protein